MTEGPFTIAFDTLCEGYQPVMEGDPPLPMSFDTYDESVAEMNDDPEFYEDCCIIPLADIGRKIIFYRKG